VNQILLTGGSGFVGGHVARGLLDDGHRVFAVLRPGAATADLDPRAEILVHDGSTDDLHRLVQTAAPDAAVHIASKFTAVHAPGDIDALVDSNLRFGLQLLDALAREGVPRLVNFGTAWQHYQTDAYRPVSLYAATKQAFEDLAAYYADAAGLRVVTLKAVGHLWSPRPAGQADLGPGRGDALGPADGAVARRASPQSRACRRRGRSGAGRPAARDGRRLRRAGRGGHAARPGHAARAPGWPTPPVDWGARPYRDREVMTPWRGEILPDWSPRIGLDAGLSALLEETIDAA
jgi:NAD(P)-dependent dehydrogenase (short-subunit alcohol dehydrogenase family)